MNQLPCSTPLEPGTAGNTLNRYLSAVTGLGTGTNPSYTWRCMLSVGLLPSTWGCSRGDEKFDELSGSVEIMFNFYTHTKSDLL